MLASLFFNQNRNIVISDLMLLIASLNHSHRIQRFRHSEEDHSLWRIREGLDNRKRIDLASEY